MGIFVIKGNVPPLPQESSISHAVPSLPTVILSHCCVAAPFLALAISPGLFGSGVAAASPLFFALPCSCHFPFTSGAAAGVYFLPSQIPASFPSSLYPSVIASYISVSGRPLLPSSGVLPTVPFFPSLSGDPPLLCAATLLTTASQPLPNMATLRNLKIKTSTCKRILKELHSYEKEVERETTKTADMKEKGADPYDLKQQENVLAESRMMVPDCHKRLEASLADLKALLEELKESNQQGPEIDEAHTVTGEVEALFRTTEA